MTGDPPDVLVWTRMQTEAGQGLERIVARKDMERRLNGGVFLWGVGNAPARGVKGFAAAGVPIPVLFSKMLSKPRTVDSSPDSIVAWTRIVGADGVARPLPRASIVTSRDAGRSTHHALHCRSDETLAIGDHGPFDHAAYRNIGDSGGPVGASQVTSLLTRRDACAQASYSIAMTAMLVEGMWTRLLDPVHVHGSLRTALDDDHDDVSWLELCSEISKGDPAIASKQPDLFS